MPIQKQLIYVEVKNKQECVKKRNETTQRQTGKFGWTNFYERKNCKILDFHINFCAFNILNLED